MSARTLMSSPTMPQKFAFTCAAAMGFALVSLFSASPAVVSQAMPHKLDAVTLPTIVVVPDAADRAAAAALDAVAQHAPSRADEA